MATCPDTQIDSNVTGLRYAWERCLKELYPYPEWKALEPNSYADFGKSVSTVARNPINPSRQRKKGTVTDMDANGGFNQDLTHNNTTDILQAFFFADARERPTTAPLSRRAATFSSVDGTNEEYNFNNTKLSSAAIVSAGTNYRVGDVVSLSGGTDVDQAAVLRVGAVNPATGAVLAITVEDGGMYGALPASPAATTGGSGSGLTLNPTGADVATFVVGDLVLASGFGVAANNGLKEVVATASGVIEAAGIVDEAAPPAGARIDTVGHHFATGDIDVTMNGQLVRLESSTVDLRTLGLIPGEWIFIGGDTAGSAFTRSRGFARVSVIDEDYIELDKVSWDAPMAESGAAVALEIYYGTIIRNESDPALIKKKPVQLERTLGRDANGVQAEYLVGAMASELTFNGAQADKIVLDLNFIACDVDHRDGTQGVKAGSRPVLEASDAFNTTSDFARIKLSSVDPTTSNPVPLFAFCTDLNLTINNNVSPSKAVGHLGAIGVTAGTFEVGGSVTAYFVDMVGPRAVANNADITMDYILVKNQRGALFDLPLVALGGGQITVEPDQAVMLPLETNAAESKFGHTLLFQSFNYLPLIARPTA